MLSETIKHHRKQRNLKQIDLANLVQCSIDTIRRWENGTREPRASDIKKLCEVLGCTEAELLDDARNNRIELTLTLNFEEFKRGEVNMMNTNGFSLVLSDDGKIGIQGLGRFISKDDVSAFIKKVEAELMDAFNIQVARGRIKPE